MSNEKQTDSLHWKNKLENLDSLPEESITDKNAAWEKLQDRLHERPRRNKIAWYWLAAACLLLALIIPWMIINKKENTLVQAPVKQKQDQPVLPAILPLNQKDRVTVLSSPSIEKNQPVKNIESNLPNKNSTAGKNIHVKKEEPLTGNTVIEKTPETAITTFPPADTIAAVKTISLVKTKLRIVHINELEPATNTDHTALAIKAEQNNFKFRFRNFHPVNPVVTPRQEYAALKIPLTN